MIILIQKPFIRMVKVKRKKKHRIVKGFETRKYFFFLSTWTNDRLTLFDFLTLRFYIFEEAVHVICVNEAPVNALSRRMLFAGSRTPLTGAGRERDPLRPGGMPRFCPSTQMQYNYPDAIS